MNRLAVAFLVTLVLSSALAGALYYRTAIEPSAAPVVDVSEAVDGAATTDARPDIGFLSAAEYNSGGEPFNDAIVDELIATLDENGVIRNRGARHEKLITVVKDLVAEMKRNRVDDVTLPDAKPVREWEAR